MFQLSISTEDPLPLVDQIVGGVRNQIDDRVLRPGARLPAIRQLSNSHGVSRFTVVEAYDRLVAQGYVHSRRGSGFYVASRNSTRDSESTAPSALPEKLIDAAWLMRQSLDAGAEGLRASGGWLPGSWLDDVGLRRHLRAMLRSETTNFTDYGRPMGFKPLREHLVFKLGALGIDTRESQILPTLGATQALDLCSHHFVRRGDTVLVDDPGYFSLFGNLRLHGARLVGVPWTTEGPDTDALERLVIEHRPKVYFMQSVLHNPTGASLSAANAFRILQCAERHDFYVVEDDTYSDFHPGITSRLAALDQLNRVVYISSFSKTLSGHLRVGYVTARQDILSALLDIKVLTSLTTPAASEEVVYRMLTEGHYRKFLERLRGRLGEATARALRMLERIGLQPFTASQGGVFVWARVPGLDDTTNLAARAAKENIILAPGTLFRPQGQASPWLRLKVVYANDVRLERVLGESLG